MTHPINHDAARRMAENTMEAVRIAPHIEREDTESIGYHVPNLARAYLALAATLERVERILADEQNAHKLTAETLTKAIRDGDKAEEYRVARDKALRKCERLRDALRPFAEMARDNTDPNEVAVSRGYASDMTLITSGDFERARRALTTPTETEG